jgi:hypothetical protein
MMRELEKHQYAGRNKNYDGPILTEYETLGIIHSNQGVIAESDPGPFMPSWQSSPVVPYYNLQLGRSL